MSEEVNRREEELEQDEANSSNEKERQTENQGKSQESSAEEEQSTWDESSEIDNLKKEKADLQDKYLRLYSEFENFRRRTAKEKLDLIQQANRDLMAEMLPVLDDFERGMESMEKTDDVSAVQKGVELVYVKFKGTLEKQGLKYMDSMGKDFDPDIHEALTKIPAPEKGMSGKVIDVIEKGYELNDKVLRHAKVVVAE